MTDDVGFGAPSHLRRRHPDAGAGPHRQRRACATPISTPRRSARRPAPRSSPAATITRSASAWSPRRRPASPATTASSARTTRPSAASCKDNGYRTSWFGKDHNTPTYQASQAGPFDQWPTGMGFEYFYGFVGGDTSQWEPNLFRNTTAIYPYVGQPGWNLTTAMADDAIHWLNQLNDIDPGDAVLLSTTFPAARTRRITPTPEWIEKISDMHLFDKGWNALRDTDLRQPEEARRDPAGRQADALAGRPAEELGRRSPPRKRSSSSARPRSTPPISPIPTTRSAA